MQTYEEDELEYSHEWEQDIDLKLLFTTNFRFRLIT